MPKLVVILVFLATLFANKSALAIHKRDSLEQMAGDAKLDDTLRTRAYRVLIEECTANEKKLADKYIQEGLHWGNKENSDFIRSRLYFAAAVYYLNAFQNFAVALDYNRKNIACLKKIKDYNELSFAYHYLGRQIYERLNMVNECIDALKKSIYYKGKFKKGHDGYLYYELGWLETFNGFADSAFVHLHKSYKSSKPEDYGFRIELLTWMGNTFTAREQHRMALKYQLKAMRLADSVKDESQKAEAYRYAAGSLRNMGSNDSSIAFMRKTVENYMQRKDDRLYYAASMLINWLAKDGKLEEAGKYIALLDDGSIYNYKEDYNSYTYYMQAKYFYAYQKKDYKNAVEYMRMYLDLKDTLDNQMKRYDIKDQNFRMAFLQQEQDLKLSQQKKEFEIKSKLTQQRTLAWSLGGIAILISALLILAIRSNRHKHKAYKLITVQKHEVERQKAIIEERNKEVTDSILYAKRIQLALLEHKDNLDEFIPENFIFFKPKDIVSGDFYWTTKKENIFYLAVCDSTGHGVPGAFMSLLNIGFLSEAINEKDIHAPNEVFEYTRKRLIHTISRENQKDGFDGTLLRLDKHTMEVEMVIANSLVFHCTDGVCKRIKADRVPVGLSLELKPFTLQKIQVKKGDRIYMLTDGYIDQFGGEKNGPEGTSGKGKKFMSARLEKLLNEINGKKLAEQHTIIEQTFVEWKGKYEQVDDVCFAGFEV